MPRCDEARDVGGRDDLQMLDAEASSRLRRPRARTRRSTLRTPRSPIACVLTWKPAAHARDATSAMCSGVAIISPLLPGSSLYGASSAAPRLPSAPSA